MSELEVLSEQEANQLANCLAHLSDRFNAAEPLLLRSLQHAESQGEAHIARCAQLRLHLSKVYLYQGRPPEALESYRQALELARKARDADTSAAIRKCGLMFELL